MLLLTEVSIRMTPPLFKARSIEVVLSLPPLPAARSDRVPLYKFRFLRPTFVFPLTRVFFDLLFY